MDIYRIVEHIPLGCFVLIGSRRGKYHKSTCDGYGYPKPTLRQWQCSKWVPRLRLTSILVTSLTERCSSSSKDFLRIFALQRIGWWPLGDDWVKLRLMQCPSIKGSCRRSRTKCMGLSLPEPHI